MRTMFSMVMVAALLVLGGCGDTHESVVKDTLSTMEEVVKVLEGVKDEASAKTAATKLEALGEEMKKMKEVHDKLGKPDAETEKKLKEKYEKRLSEVSQKLMQEMMRIATNPALGKHIQDAMGKMRM